MLKDVPCKWSWHLSTHIFAGKPQKPLPDLLREYNLPPGLFPKNITCYEFDEAKAKLIVYLPSSCEVSFKDSSVIRYSNRVKGTLSRGKLNGIDGMKIKVLMWVKVTSVAVESYKSDKVWFMAGVKKSRPKDAYEMPREAIKVEELWGLRPPINFCCRVLCLWNCSFAVFSVSSRKRNIHC